MKKLRALAISAVVGAILGATAFIAPASALTLGATDGFDVSYPQCGRTTAATLPAPGGFSIIGVDGGRVYDANPCLVAQLQWAKAGNSKIQLYVNSGNPGGPSLVNHTTSPASSYTVTHWPSGTSSPKVCAAENPATANVFESDTIACAYDYGYLAAQSSYQRATTAFTAAGLSYAPNTVNWWIDLEEGNTWRSHDLEFTHPNDGNLTQAQLDARNRASMLGAHDYLVNVAQVKQLGFYGSPNGWTSIMNTTTMFRDHPYWYPIGAASRSDALAKCATFRNVSGVGQPVYVQYVDTGADIDVSVRCNPASNLTYASATSATRTSSATTTTLSARLRTAGSSIGLHGQNVEFVFRGKTYTARTAAGGLATVTVPLPAQAGNFPVTVRYRYNTYLATLLTTSLSVTLG